MVLSSSSVRTASPGKLSLSSFNRVMLVVEIMDMLLLLFFYVFVVDAVVVVIVDVIVVVFVFVVVVLFVFVVAPVKI